MKSDTVVVVLISLAAALVLFNQYSISSISSAAGQSGFLGIPSGFLHFGGSDISKVDVMQSHSTQQTVALLFPVDKIKTISDAAKIMLPTGTPEYGPALGISYDDPVAALDILENKVYPMMANSLQSDSAAWERYVSLATKPVGISCDFCCGVGTVAVNSKGQLICGCSHNIALQGLTMWLIKNTNYSNAQVLQEVIRWKSLWFPKDMVGMAYQVATQGVPSTASGSPSAEAQGSAAGLDQLSGQVGGC